MKTETTSARHRAETPAAWLEELGVALRMPYERAEAIREELAEHLRERVRDLELEGLDEAAAASAAVRELGDAAAVARRFRSAERTPIRRRLMNLAVIGIAGVALVTSIVAVNGEGAREESPRALLERAVTVMRDDPTSEEVQPLLERAVKAADSSQRAQELRLRIETAIAGTDETGIELTLVPELVKSISAPQREVPVLKGVPLVSMLFARQEGATPGAVEGVKFNEERLEDALKWLSAQAGLTPTIRWRQLEEAGISADDKVTVNAAGSTEFAAVMSAINESRGVFDPSEAAAIEYRVKEGVIEFATRESFDRRESALVSYNITHLIESGVDLEEVRKAITSFVDPEEWEDNGGNLGTMMIVGNRMFVKAPPRMQEGVKWFIEQLAGQDGAPAAAGERAPAAALPAERNNLVYVSGLVDRPGPYNHPGDELTLRRVLISASIKPDAEEATVVRGPAEQPMTIGTLRGADLFDPTGADFEIRPGDIVTVK